MRINSSVPPERWSNPSRWNDSLRRKRHESNWSFTLHSFPPHWFTILNTHSETNRCCYRCLEDIFMTWKDVLMKETWIMSNNYEIAATTVKRHGVLDNVGLNFIPNCAKVRSKPKTATPLFRLIMCPIGKKLASRVSSIDSGPVQILYKESSVVDQMTHVHKIVTQTRR